MTDEEKLTLYEQRVEDIEAILAGKATEDIKHYEINGRSADKYSIDELISLVKYFKEQINKIKRKTMPKKVVTRFM